MPEHLYDEAVALWHESGLTRPWNDPVEDLQRAMRGPASTVLAALDDGQLIGTAMVGHDGHRGWVYYVAVTLSAQRQGIGSALMKACEEWVASRGVPKLQLMVRTTNAEVAQFYARLGYADADVLVLSKLLEGGDRAP